MTEREILAYRTFFEYQRLRFEDKAKDRAWDSYLENAVKDAYRQNNPEELCYAMWIAMAAGGMNYPDEERARLGEFMLPWSKIAERDRNGVEVTH